MTRSFRPFPEGVDAERTARLFRCAPFGQNTWRLLDGYDKQVRDRYWQEVLPDYGRRSEAESMELIDRLLEAGRPLVAFHAVQYGWARVETSRLKRLLHAVATVTAEPKEHYRLEAHQISEALNSLDGRPGVSPDEMVQLEFMYIQALDRSEHGIPNLERQVAESPATFFQVLAFMCTRRDHGDDPSGIADRKSRTAQGDGRFLPPPPGSNEPNPGYGGKTARSMPRRYRPGSWESAGSAPNMTAPKSATMYIGQLLAKAPPDDGGFWPCPCRLRSHGKPCFSTHGHRFQHRCLQFARRAGARGGEAGRNVNSFKSTRTWRGNVRPSIPTLAVSLQALHKPMTMRRNIGTPKQRSKRGERFEQ